jgi:hypothetical protein
MALQTNAFPTYSAIGNREDLSDEIYRIDPTDTPFLSGIDKTRATAVNHEWQTQALASPDGANAQLEGDDYVAVAATPTVRLGNITQISNKRPSVTGTQESVRHAGRDSELDYQVMLKGAELKRDMETILLSNQAKATGSTTVVRKLASVLSWIKTNTDKGATGADPVSADGTGTRTDGTQRAFTETQFRNVLQSIWFNGGKPGVVIANGFNKQQFSNFTGRGTPMQDQADRKITAAVDTYQSDFGTLKIVADRFGRTRDVLILQMDMWGKAALPGRDMLSTPIAKVGDSERRLILSEYTLEARNEKASGGVFDLTTS